MLFALLIAVGCSEEKKEQPAPAPAADNPAKGEPGIALPGGEAPTEPGGEIGVKLPQKTVADPADQTLATRCAFDVGPKPTGCGDRTLGSIALGPDGALYLVEHGVGVRRYNAARSGSCSLTLDRSFGDDGVMPFPKVEPLKQKLDGKVYMRSGGPSFELTTTGGSVYMFDYLDGIHRIAGSKGLESCVGIGGVKAFALRGGAPIILQSTDLVRLDTGKTCKAGKPIKSPLRANGMLVDGSDIYLAGTAGSNEHRVARVDRKGKVVFTAGNEDAFADDGMCYAGQLADCGDAICAVDGNCKKVVRFAKKDGAHVGTWKMQALFGDAVYHVAGLAPAADGSLWAAVSLRDPSSDQCEPAIFLLPPQ